MYGRRKVDDTVRYWKAVASNALAARAPALYVRLTGETGRGRETRSPEQLADYFLRCRAEQDAVLGLDAATAPGFYRDLAVMEYGPGDCPGFALCHLAAGARAVTCVDRFPLVKLSAPNVETLRALMARLRDDERRRAGEAFVVAGDPASGLRPDRLRYEVRADGLIGAREAYDLVTSRAVLEHVSDLASTYVDMARALRSGGTAVHLVDLKSHGLHREHPLDFLTWPAAKWRRMYAGKGFPNRHRLDRHRDLAAAAGLKVERVEVVDRVPADTLAAVRPHLDAEFRHLSDDDLSALGFWLTARKR